jgi:N utilization substance protein B
VGARSSGREAALQMLYALDVGRELASADGPPPDGAEVVIHDFWREIPGDSEGKSFADELVLAISADLEGIDARIRSASKHWRLERMARVDRNVLRLGVYELSHDDGTPRAVIIDEAVELAKRFGAEGSHIFVNGVLDRIADEVGR